MPKRIVVAVESDIIRKGLVAIARQVAGFSVLDRKGVREVQKCDLSLENIIVFDQFSLSEVEHAVKEFKNHRIELVALAQSPISSSDWEGHAILVNDSEYDIQSLFNRIYPQKIEDKESGLSNELSARERDVLKLVALGLSNKETADKLFISIHTVITHRKNITEKLGIKSISGLTVYAIINGIIDSDSINVSELI
jgi:DNA-binding CsgD family transcriptional regulator